MTFLPNIPQPGNFLSVSQGNLLTNFQSLDASFDVDHTTFSNATANNGKHAQVTLFEAQSDPTLTFPVSMIYSKNSGTTPNRFTDLFYATKPETASMIINQLTNLPIVASTNLGTAGGSLSYIDTPWNFRIYFGLTDSIPGNTTRTVVFSPAYTTVVMGNVMAASGSSTVNSNALENLNGLSIFTSNTVTVYWFMMGRL